MRWLFLCALALTLLPAGALADKWIVRPKESAIALVITFEGVPIDARFQRWSAAIDFDPANLTQSKADVRIDPASFDSQSDERDEVAKDDDWFAVMKFPEARFVTRSITKTGEGRYEAAADLIVRGVSRGMKFPFSLAIEGPVARMDGTITVNRADWGIGQGQWKATGHVGANVVIKVHVVADRV